MPELNVCPKCGTPLIVRENRKYGTKFLACPRWPKCEGYTAPYKPSKPAVMNIKKPADINISDLQAAIINEFTETAHNIIVSARAGTGKSTTLALICNAMIKKCPNIKIGVIVFAKDAANVLISKIGAAASFVGTSHSLGKQIIQRDSRYKNCKVDNLKNDKIIKNLWGDYSEDDRNRLASTIKKLYNLKMETGLESSELIEKSSLIEVEYKDIPLVTAGVDFLIKNSPEIKGEIDFSDMICLNAYALVNVPVEFDIVLVDEAQDLNYAQLEFISRISRRWGFVGDEFQAIFGFRGAMTDSMLKIRQKFNTVELPLNVTYRCCRAIVRYANESHPYVNLVCGRDSEGIVQSAQLSNIAACIDEFEGSKLILCRNNAPLTKIALKLLAQGKIVKIAGKALYEDLTNLISKNEKDAATPAELVDNLNAYYNVQYSKYNGRAAFLPGLLDKIECIDAICQSDTITSILDIYTLLSRIYSGTDNLNNDDIINLSTIHRAKGGEADNCYLICPELIGSKCKNKEEEQQELNLHYVAITRGKDTLTIFNTDYKL